MIIKLSNIPLKLCASYNFLHAHSYSCYTEIYLQLAFLSNGSLILRSGLWVRIILISCWERRILLPRLWLRIRSSIRCVITSWCGASVHRWIISISLRERIRRGTRWTSRLSLKSLHLLLGHLVPLHSELHNYMMLKYNSKQQY